MKRRNFLAVLLLSMGVVLSACSSDSNNDGPDPTPGPGEDTGYGYFALKASDSNVPVMTKADPDDGNTEIGTEDESNIKAIRIVLYNAANGAVNYTFDYTTTTTTGAVAGSAIAGAGSGGKYTYFTPTGGYTSSGILAGSQADFQNGIKTEGELVVLQDYKLLVLVNPTTEMKTWTAVSGGLTADAFLAQVKKGLPANQEYLYFTGASTNEFVMSNFQGFINVKESDLKQTKSAAETAPVEVYVERAVAKVQFAAKGYDLDQVDTDNKAILENANWNLDITNTASYIMRHQAPMYNGNTEYTNPAVAAVSRYHFYAQDPNMKDVSWEKYLYYGNAVPSGLQSVNPNTVFNYLTDAEVNKPLSASATVTNHLYTFENTMDADEQYEDVTTAAILKIDFKPIKTAVDGLTGFTPGETQNATGWSQYYVWTYGSTKYVFTAENLAKIAAMVTLDPAYVEFTALHEFLTNTTATQDDAGNPISGGSKGMLEGLFGDDYAFNGVALPTESMNSAVVGGSMLTYYHTPTNYYRVLVRHFNNTLVPTPMAYGRYGVVRNNVYKLTLNTVYSPGDITIPKPTGPDDKYAYLGVDIKVLPWIIRTQDVEL